MLDKGDYFYTDNSMRPVLEALVPKLTSEQVTRTQETLLEVLKKSTDQRLSRHVGDLLVALASKLTHEQKNRTADLLVSELQRHVNLYLTEPLDDLLSQTDSETQERVSSKAMRMLLDYLATSNTYFDDDYEEVRDPDRVFGHAAMSVTNQRALATLFRHPACIGEAREWMLLRFEELVLHGGNRIYFSIEQPKEDEEEKTDAANTPKPAPPPRRFKTLHDASTWIQKNWPDFDLESTPEVKPWREE